jgi:hypothetical protein
MRKKSEHQSNSRYGADKSQVIKLVTGYREILNPNKANALYATGIAYLQEKQ